MLPKFGPGIWVLVIGFLISGCTGKPIQIGALMSLAQQPKLSVAQAEPVNGESRLSNRSLELRNCDGKEDLIKSLASEAQVICTIGIADTATAVKSGAILDLSPETKTNLEEQVKSVYQSAYDEARASVEQKVVVVPIGKIHKYKIYWKQQVFNSTVSFSTDNVTYTAPYTYTLDIPRITITEQTGCTA